MRRKVFLLLLLVWETAELVLSMLRQNRIGAALSLSVFSGADALVWMARPFEYIMAALIPVIAGSIVLLRGYPSKAGILLYKNKRTLFVRQLASAVVWDLLVSVLYVGTVAAVCFLLHKDMINWDRAASYFALTMHRILPGVGYWNVFAMCLAALFIRNMVFLLFIMVCWWAFSKTIYGVALISCICFAETGTDRVKLVLRNIWSDYGFWISRTDKAVFWLVSAVLLCVLFVLLEETVKRKEF